MKTTLISRLVSNSTVAGANSALGLAAVLSGAATPREVIAVLLVGWAVRQ